MKTADWELFEAAYCGVCRELGRRYGLLYRNFLSYDFVLLALLLAETPMETGVRRCMAHPGRRRCMGCRHPSLERAADATVLFAAYKLRDDALDFRGVKRLLSRVLSHILRRPLAEASQRLPQTAAALETGMERLHALEAERVVSMDRPADTFARSLAALAEAAPENSRPATAELLRHLGRWIYIIDAVDDLKDDSKAGRYNPVAARFALTGGDLTPELQAELRHTLACSRYAAAEVYEQLSGQVYPQLVRNILTAGMAGAENRVFTSHSAGTASTDTK